MAKGKFAEELAKIPYSVSVVTVGLGGRENGLTVSWMTQVSNNPPMLAIAINKLHYSADILADIPHFVVNLLGEEQGRLAGHFARQSMTGEDKLEGFATRPAASEVPILTDALAWFDCERRAGYEVGDHLLLIGEVMDAGILDEGRPMTTLDGLRYRPQ